MSIITFEKINPPGTFCTFFGLHDLIGDTDLRNIKFLEIGCGEGIYSKYLLHKGAHGVAIDFSVDAINVAKKNLGTFIDQKKLSVLNLDFMNCSSEELGKFDIVFSVMVLEHVKDQELFLRRTSDLLNAEGKVIIIVPARQDAWGVEDDLAGHLRRYSRKSLTEVCELSGLTVQRINSIGVPVVNMLLFLSNFLVSKYENKKAVMNNEHKTKLSGTREIPFKTVFPSFFKIILNQLTLYPLKLIQRFFYKSDKGLILGVSLKKSIQI